MKKDSQPQSERFTAAMVRRALSVLLYLLLAAGFGLAPSGSAETVTPSEKPPAHHTARGFRNLYPDTHHTGVGSTLRYLLGLYPKEIPAIPPDRVPPYKPEIVVPDLDLIRHPDPGRIQLTWIGHSSFLLQVNGLNILLDPVYSERASPFSFAGPKRLVPPGVRFEDLPPIDAVVISHNHFDHLDKPTIKRLGNKPRYFVPLGVRTWFSRLGIDRVSELDWWQRSFIGETVLCCVPALHWSGRGPFRRNHELWAGWVIETKQGRIYFAGDSGYSPYYKEIGTRLGPFRLSMIPIGTYRPAWYFKPMHQDPAEAVQAHRDVGSAFSVGMHWGTFKTSTEPSGEPPIFLKKALREAGLPEDQFVVMKFGQTLVLDWQP
jgi:L-ascorbate metabolism protein UlaG (beta-lactamase superfamily)